MAQHESVLGHHQILYSYHYINIITAVVTIRMSEECLNRALYKCTISVIVNYIFVWMVTYILWINIVDAYSWNVYDKQLM